MSVNYIHKFEFYLININSSYFSIIMSRFYNQYRDLFIDQFPLPRSSNEVDLQRSPNHLIKSSKLMMQPNEQRTENVIAQQEYYNNQAEYNQNLKYNTSNVARPAHSVQNEKGDRLKNVYSMIVNNPIENSQKLKENNLNQMMINPQVNYSYNSPLLSMNKMREYQKQNVNKSIEEKNSYIPNYPPMNYQKPINYSNDSRINPPYSINLSENINSRQLENYNRGKIIPTYSQNSPLYNNNNNNIKPNFDEAKFPPKSLYQDQPRNSMNTQIPMDYDQDRIRRIDANSLNPNYEIAGNEYNQNSYQMAISRRMEYKNKLIVK